MSVIIRYPLKIQNVISEIKSQEAYVVIPASEREVLEPFLVLP